jgi:hypothetical protein
MFEAALPKAVAVVVKTVPLPGKGAGAKLFVVAVSTEVAVLVSLKSVAARPQL